MQSLTIVEDNNFYHVKVLSSGVTYTFLRLSFMFKKNAEHVPYYAFLAKLQTLVEAAYIFERINEEWGPIDTVDLTAFIYTYFGSELGQFYDMVHGEFWSYSKQCTADVPVEGKASCDYLYLDDPSLEWVTRCFHGDHDLNIIYGMYGLYFHVKGDFYDVLHYDVVMRHMEKFTDNLEDHMPDAIRLMVALYTIKKHHLYDVIALVYTNAFKAEYFSGEGDSLNIIQQWLSYLASGDVESFEYIFKEDATSPKDLLLKAAELND